MLEPHAGYLHFGAAIQVAFRSHVLGGSCQITPPSDFFCSCRIENVVAAAATATALGGGTFQPPGLAQGQTGDRKRGVGPVVKLQDRDQHAGPPPRSQGKGGRLRRPRLGRLRAFPGCPHRRPGRSFRVASAKKKHATPPAGAGPGAAANTVPSLPALEARPGARAGRGIPRVTNPREHSLDARGSIAAPILRRNGASGSDAAVVIAFYVPQRQAVKWLGPANRLRAAPTRTGRAAFCAPA